jgi:hypothetical protein
MFGLLELVEEAREALVTRSPVAAWYRSMAEPEHLAEQLQAVAEGLSEIVCRLCAAGQYHRRCMDDIEYFHDDAYWHLRVVSSCPLWGRFSAVVELAAQIDSFLFALESHCPCPPLARDCRRDLDLLTVLADACQDAGLLLSAQTARSLLSLVQSARRDIILADPDPDDDGPDEETDRDDDEEVDGDLE